MIIGITMMVAFSFYIGFILACLLYGNGLMVIVGFIVMVVGIILVPVDIY